MKIVIAIDSFKGSMTSMEAGNAAMRGIKRACNADIQVFPLADGGEGTTEALVEGMNGQYRTVCVSGPMDDKVNARYGVISDRNMAVIEMAQAAGITLVPTHKLNPWKANTYGVGEMILDALKNGCRKFIIGIGGSATTEVGIGMLSALGYVFLDKNGNKLPFEFNSLGKVYNIVADNVPDELNTCSFQIACDVDNPLYGERGAVRIFGKQKGVKPEDMPQMDRAVVNFAEKTAAFVGRDLSNEPGAGAAGGLGFALMSFLNHTQVRPGISIVLDEIGIEKILKYTDFVVTGEGRIDEQTAMGKAPIGVAKLAKKYGCKVIAFAGSVTENASECNREGIDAFFPIVRGVIGLSKAMNPAVAKKNMELAAEQTFRLINILKN